MDLLVVLLLGEFFLDEDGFDEKEEQCGGKKDDIVEGENLDKSKKKVGRLDYEVLSCYGYMGGFLIMNVLVFI